MTATPSSNQRPLANARLLQIVLALAAGLLGIVLWAHGGEPRSPGEQAVRYRHALYTVIAWNGGQMRAMLDGSREFDQARFAAAAAHVASLSPLLSEAFPAGSNLPPKSAARPEVWREWPDFEHRLAKLQAAGESLAAAAAGSDRERVRSAFANLTDNCKSCHAHYKQDD